MCANAREVNLVDKDKAEVLEALKKFNSTEVDLQRNENDKLHLRIKHLEKEILEQDNTLRKIHAEKPSASDITEVNRDLQKTLEDIRTATTAGRGEYNGSPLDEYVSGMQARIHEYRGQLHTKQQVQNAIIPDPSGNHFPEPPTKPAATLAPLIQNNKRNNLLSFTSR